MLILSCVMSSAAPSSRFFNSSSVYAVRQAQGAEHNRDSQGAEYERDSQSFFGEPASLMPTGGKRAALQAGGKYSFGEPEPTEFSVKTSGNTVSSSAPRSSSQFAFSEPGDTNHDGDDTVDDKEEPAATAVSVQDKSSIRSFAKTSGKQGQSSGSCEEPKPGAPADTGGAAAAPSAFKFGTKASASAEPVAAPSGLPSLADMFKPKPGEWDCPKCMTRNKADAKFKCMSCEEPKPGAPADTGGAAAAPSAFQFGTSALIAPAVSSGSSGGFKFGTAALTTSSVPSSGFIFGTSKPAESTASAASAPVSKSFGVKKDSSQAKDISFGAKPEPVQAPLPDAPKAAAAVPSETKEDPNAAKKAEEAKKKGWVTTGFVWPDKKVDVGFESTGSKELDAEDAAEGRAPAGTSAPAETKPPAAAPSAPVTGSSPFTFLGAAPTGGSAPISATFSFGGASGSGAGSASAFSFEAKADSSTEASAGSSSGTSLTFGFGASASSTAAGGGSSAAAPAFSFSASTATPCETAASTSTAPSFGTAFASSAPALASTPSASGFGAGEHTLCE